MTACVPGSTLSTALQQGQVTSKAAVDFLAIKQMIPQLASAFQFDGEDFEDGEQFPTYQYQGNHYNQNGQRFTEAEPRAFWLKLSSHKPENIESGKTKDQNPKNIKGIAAFGEVEKSEDGGERGAAAYCDQVHL